ncbi:MAG: 8-oxoguanine DNA glycosylase [Clostridia bacterium]|nr:8-oxoguanine DNA glycosylase [Clostridia bacterium]
MTKFELNEENFELAHIFECGQCFRWKKEKDGTFIGVIKDGVVSIKKEGLIFSIESNIEKEKIKDYLDLSTDYTRIKRTLSKNDDNMKLASEYGYGIRILNQDPWEMLISYIISAANNIPRISKTIENICKVYGKKIEFKGSTYYLFPTPQELSRASIQNLRDLNLGFRDKYVYGATQMVLKGELDLEKIKLLPYAEAKKELIKVPGVGEKVADCILLFSMKKKEAFPVDTWIKKVMMELYVDTKDVKKISSYAEAKFGKYAGIAQQYLFYWKRENA